MIGAVVDVAASAGATAAVMTVPGIAALAAMRARRVLPTALLPAAAVTATVLVAAPCLIATFALQWSIVGFALALAVATLLLAVVGVLRREAPIGDRQARRTGRWRAAAWYAPPTLLLGALAAADAPHVRSDTYWHVALARKLGEFEQLSSAQVAFGAGTPGNSSYPLPVWHALLAVADHAPRVDLWYAAWFLTIWLAPVAMYAFGAMAGALVGHRHATLAGCWVFLAVVVLGYGPWFFASRYLSYPGQVAIFVVLPIVLWAFVRLLEDAGPERRRLHAVLVASVVAIGVLHANYELFPSLFVLGGATLMLLAGRDRTRHAFGLALAVVGTGALTLAVQLPWIMHDANFLRGDTPPDGAPSAFIRHRDVLTGSEEWFWLQLGSLAAQPWLVVGALALPLLLAWRHRHVGPWVVAGGALAIVVTGRTPWIVHLIDAAGSITPVTRLDRVYPAAVGVLGLALLAGTLLRRLPGGGVRVVVGGMLLAACAAGTWWVDSIRDTRRIVVTPFVEARWVGGLDPGGIPLAAVWTATVVTVVVALAVRWRIGGRSLRHGRSAGIGAETGVRFATAVVVAIVVGLAPATVERVHAAWEPQAFDRAARADQDFVRIEVYPARVRSRVASFEPAAVVFADVVNVRRVASLVPVQVVGEGIIRQLEDEPVRSVEEATALLDEPQEGMPGADYLVVSRSNEAFEAFVDAARSCGWADRSAGALWILERGSARC